MATKAACALNYVLAVSVALLMGQQRMVHADEAAPDLWMKTKTGCQVFTPHATAKRVTWTGHCKNRYAAGQGVVAWYGMAGGKSLSMTGTMVAGKMQGHVVVRSGDETIRYDGEVRDNIEDGEGTFYYDDGRYEGGWIKGDRSGQGKLYKIVAGDKASKLASQHFDQVYKGGFRNDNYNGYGELDNYDSDGQILDKLVGNYENGNAMDGAVLYNSYENKDGSSFLKKSSILQDGKFVNVETEDNSVSPPTESPDSDESETSTSSAGLQAIGAALNTAIQVRGVKDAATQQRAYQVAANQQVRANAAAPAQAQLAAAQAQQAAAQAQTQQVASAKPHSQDATKCVRQDGNQLINTCSETITVVWCVVGDGSNCDRGLDMESEIRAGGSTPALPLKHPNVPIAVHYAACTGWMTAVAQGMQAKCD